MGKKRAAKSNKSVPRAVRKMPERKVLPPASSTLTKPLNRSLSAAKAAKQDEFYTQYVDIQKEVEAYLEYDASEFERGTFRKKIVYCNCDEAYLEYNPDTFRNKVVYCNCDDPFESNFFKYFAANFNKLRLKRVICTSYDEGNWGSPLAGQMTLFDEYNGGENRGNGHRKKPKAIAVIVDHVNDENNDDATDIEDV